VKPRLVGAAARHRQVLERHRVEVVVGERDEAEPAPPQLDDFTDDAVDLALTGLLAVGAPDGAERAVLRASAHGLHRRPHVATLRQQVPPRGDELVARDAAAVVDPLRPAGETIGDHSTPDDVAVPLYDRVRAAVLVDFVGKERRMDAAVDHPRAFLAHLAADFVAFQRIAGMDADADDVAGRDVVEIDGFERFIDQVRVTPLRSRCRGQYIKPPGRDDRHAE
jgi:hypothetical protein